MTFTPDQHAAMEGVAPFPLAEEVHLPSGRKLAGTRARVYSLLRQTAERGERHRIGNSGQLGPAGWVPGYYLQRAWSGGVSGDRRRRDLSEIFGVQLESMRFSGDSATVLYRWVSDGSQAPVESRTPDASRSRVAQTLPGARNGRMGGLAPRFYTCVGFPGEDAPGRVRLTGGFDEHPLAMGPLLVGHVLGGRLSTIGALEAYDASLKARWPKLRAWLERGGEHVLWLPPEVAETINPLPLLVEILGKCGAECLGDWQVNRRHEQQGVA